MFNDRREAGRQLARRLVPYAALEPVVVGLPRGGVPVAAEVADRLGVPLDVMVVRKIGCPWQPELGIGAIAEGGVRVLNDALVEKVGIEPIELEAATAREGRNWRGAFAAIVERGRQSRRRPRRGMRGDRGASARRCAPRHPRRSRSAGR